MADIVANADYCPESDLNEMTVEWEKGEWGKISRRVGQFSRAETGQFWRALKDHRCFDVGMAHGFHDCVGVCTRHGHLRPEGMPKPMDANVGDTRAFACTVQAFTDVI